MEKKRIDDTYKKRNLECMRISTIIGLKTSPDDRDRNRQMEGERPREKDSMNGLKPLTVTGATIETQ